MDRSQEPSGRERTGREQSLPTHDAVAFKKEREEKDDGRYIIFYTFEEDEAASEEEGAG
ncbi:MAG: hypothetical protein M3Q60_07940 [Actinomycetota bacterium]|nr:hypothetical protein [Actinomycetota bacterium]